MNAAAAKKNPTVERHAAAVSHAQILDALPHPIILLDADDNVVLANPSAELFFGVGLAVMRRGKLADMLTFGCPLSALIDQVHRTRSTVNEYGVEITLPRAETTNLVDIYGGPLGDGSDMTILMLLERSMAQMIERQLTHRSTARSVSGMAAVLAHEIKNPLSGIRGAAQLLEPHLSDEDRALTQLICTETDRIRSLLDRMEVFGDERPIVREPVNIHTVLDHVRQVAEAGFARGIDFHSEYDPSLPPVPGVRDKLVQAFLNLVKNAAEAIIEADIPAGRVTLVTAFRPGVRLTLPGSDARVSLPLMIEISDNGPGIPDSLKPYLFDAFVSSKHKGSGLGLALVAKIIGDHGGTIEFETSRRNTVFRVLLPLHESSSKPTAKGAS